MKSLNRTVVVQVAAQNLYEFCPCEYGGLLVTGMTRLASMNMQIYMLLQL